MGTNYYLERPGSNPCAHCGRSDNSERMHIGKSSGGWCFSLHVDPANGINDLDDWKKLFPTGRIVDEYGEEFSSQAMLRIICERTNRVPFDGKEWWGYGTEERFHEMNHSERGPNNLLRNKLGDHCIKHGEGTWDCIVGEFS